MVLVPLKKSINRDAPSFWTHGAKHQKIQYLLHTFSSVTNENPITNEN
jgi:hypothetical protein